jgi:hypothetical protein
MKTIKLQLTAISMLQRMKSCILMLMSLLAFNTVNAQIAVLDWIYYRSTAESISGGIYETKSTGFTTYGPLGFIRSYSNEYYEATEDSIQGVIRSIDSGGTVQWTTIIPQVAKVSAFPLQDQGLVGIPDPRKSNWQDWIDPPWLTVPYNISPTTSRLIQMDSLGNIVWNVALTNINRVSDWTVDSLGNTYLVGRTPETDSAGIKSNGIAIAKYDASGVQVWQRTKYTSGFRTSLADSDLGNEGEIIVCGKKAPKLMQPYTAYDKTFVTKYDNNGTALWTKEFTSFVNETDILTNVVADTNDDTWFADTQYDSQGNPTVYLRKLNGATGATVFTKKINNSGLICGFVLEEAYADVVATTTGMRCYNTNGMLLWSNNFIVQSYFLFADELFVVAKNVSATAPDDNHVIILDQDGIVLYQKNLSFGNHEEYMGDYSGVIVDGPSSMYVLINDTTPPYSTRITKLSSCDQFTYSFNATAAGIDVNNASCNNGQITVNWTGTFNSWMHLELWEGSLTTLPYDYDLSTTSHTFQNLTPGIYTVKAFDESCGAQEMTVIVRCPSPSSGFATTNITKTKAKLNWSAPACAGGYAVQYRMQGNPNWISVTTTNPYKQLSGLTPNMLYEWQVATKCGSETPAIYSDYSAVQTFSTPAQRPDMNEDSDDVANSEVTVYPNPVSNELTISTGSGLPASHLIVVNSFGQVVMEKSAAAINENETLQIETASLAKGIYLLQIVSEGEMVVKRFVKE